MPVSSGSAGGLPGMNLKAWVLMTSAGVIVKSFNVTSITKGGTGVYTVNFTAAMSSVNYVGVYVSGVVGSSAVTTANVSAVTVGSAQVSVANGGSAFDTGGLWAFYE